MDPEIPDRWRLTLVSGALAKLYGAQDTAVYNAKQRDYWERRWGGEVMRAREQLGKQQRTPGQVRFSAKGVW